MELWVEQQRGGFVEARHRVHACLCDASGHVLARVGTDLLTTFRSAAKPFQLEASLGLLPASLVQSLPDDLLALGAASHHGELLHEQGVARLLDALACAPSALLCGVHPPFHAASYAALLRSGREPTSLHHNCAGKHAFMAAAARASGAAADYRPHDHAVQRAALHCVEEATGEREPPCVVDGCGVSCFVLRLSAMARAYARLAHQFTAAEGTRGRIVRAMASHPWMVSGTGAFDLWLTTHGAHLAKVGAGGLLCAALPGGLGFALKCESGSDLVRAVACDAALRAFLPHVLHEALPEHFARVDNAAGQRVGAIVTRFAAD